MAGKMHFIFLFLLSLLFFLFIKPGWTLPEPGWTIPAAREAGRVARVNCSGHGRAYLDGVVGEDGLPICECHNCYNGTDCSQLLSDCVADAELGDAWFLEPYWYNHKYKSAVLTSGWHRMSYLANGEDYMSIELQKYIKQLHEVVGNAITEDKYIIFGNGARQLVNAFVYALAPQNSSKYPCAVVTRAPYYPMFKEQTQLFNGRDYFWGGDANKWVNSTYKNIIEIVTSPDNPDGLLKQQIVDTKSVIFDRVYYWPQYSAIPEPANDDIMIFSSSKLSGHAGSRFGWAFIKDKDVYDRVAEYIKLNTIGVSRDSQLRMLNIVKVMIAECGKETDFFEFGHEVLKKRWNKLRSVVSPSGRFSLQNIPRRYSTYFNKIVDPSPSYGWLKCEWQEETDCAQVLKDGGIISRDGPSQDADSRYTRLSLVKTNDDFDQLIERMKILVGENIIDSL